MTDFYTAFHERTNQIIQETRKQLENYQIEVKHRDGVYRHLVCFNPEKGQECSFEVYTAPHIVTIQGDWCKAYTLKAERDMLTEFLNDDEPNVNYWAEKVQNRTDLKTFSPSIILSQLEDYLDEWAVDNDIAKESVKSSKNFLRRHLDVDDPVFFDQLRDWGFRFVDIYGEPLWMNPLYGFDFENADWNVWTGEWIRVCELLRWTACKVTEMEATRGC